MEEAAAAAAAEGVEIVSALSVESMNLAALVLQHGGVRYALVCSMQYGFARGTGLHHAGCASGPDCLARARDMWPLCQA